MHDPVPDNPGGGLLQRCRPGAERKRQDTNDTDTRRTPGDTSYYLRTDSWKQKDLVDPDVPEV